MHSSILLKKLSFAGTKTLSFQQCHCTHVWCILWEMCTHAQ